MAQARFYWQGEEGASIEAGIARLWLVAVKHQWAIYEGYTPLGMAARTDEDQTPRGEARLWMRIAAVLQAQGRKVDDWTVTPTDNQG